MPCSQFRTLPGYDKLSARPLTRSMEDYLEMICRLCLQDSFARIHDLAERLHVKPSSASKMAALLKEQGYVTYEKYGVLMPTDKGWKAGRNLLYRHDVIQHFLCLVNQTEDELEQTEKIEHFLTADTVKNLELLTQYLACDSLWPPLG